MWETLIHDPNKLGACSWELPEIRQLKEQLANLKCDCGACGYLNRPTLYRRVHETADTDVQVDSVLCDGTTEMEDNSAAFDSLWEMLVNDRRVDPKTKAYLSNKKGNLCPGCMLALSIFRDKYFRVMKDQPSDALNPMTLADNFTTYDIYFAEKSTSMPFCGQKKTVTNATNLINGLYDCIDSGKTQSTQAEIKSCTEDTCYIPKCMMFEDNLGCELSKNKLSCTKLGCSRMEKLCGTSNPACMMDDESLSCDRSSCGKGLGCCYETPARVTNLANLNCDNSSCSTMQKLSYDHAPARVMIDENVSCDNSSCYTMQKSSTEQPPGRVMKEENLSCDRSSCSALKNDDSKPCPARVMKEESLSCDRSSCSALKKNDSEPCPATVIKEENLICDRSSCSALKKNYSEPCPARVIKDENLSCDRSSCSALKRLSFNLTPVRPMKDEKLSCDRSSCSALLSGGPTPPCLMDDDEISCNRSTCSALQELESDAPPCLKNFDFDKMSCCTRKKSKPIPPCLMVDEQVSCDKCSTMEDDSITYCPYVLGTLCDGPGKKCWDEETCQNTGTLCPVEGGHICCPKDGKRDYCCPLDILLRDSYKKKETKSTSVCDSGGTSCKSSEFSCPVLNDPCRLYMCYTQDGSQYPENDCFRILDDEDDNSCNPCLKCNNLPKKQSLSNLAENLMNFIRPPLRYPIGQEKTKQGCPIKD